MCKFPYLYNNITEKCDITFAEAIGFNYDIYWAFFLAFAILTFLVALIQNIRLCIANDQGVLEKNEKAIYFDKVIMRIIMTMSILLLIEGIDPQGFRGVLPLIIEGLSSNLCTFLGYTIVYYYMYILITGLREYNNIYGKIAWASLGGLTMIVTIVLTSVQVYVDWGFSRGLKLALFAALILATSVVLITILVNRYLLLMRLAKQDVHSKQKEKMLKYLISYCVFVAVIFSYQVYAADYAFKHLEEKPTPEITPDQITFPLLQWLAICLILILKWNVAGVNVDVSKFISDKTRFLSQAGRNLRELNNTVSLDQSNPIPNDTFTNENFSPEVIVAQDSPSSLESHSTL